ncbi:hypothetical protein [Pseudorhodoferax sp.]|uniref:hypothetical protein n=1 Tax=Pseudorhodoferax sp. TaxID=1993553 RepID=UPI002DD65406|nr:hypothetical protein [Pseudorhodoferax sp.]
MRWRTAHAIWIGWALASSALAQQTAPPAAATAAQERALVFTRATVQSVFDEDKGRKHYIRLKLGPGSGLPFRTLTFRVRDPEMVAPFPPGTGVEFVAQRVDGENTLTALRAAPKLLRFESH